MSDPNNSPKPLFRYGLPGLACCAAAVMAYLHIFHADVSIDGVGLALLAAIFLPWVFPYVKKLKFGDAEIELQALRQKVDQVADAQRDVADALSEPAQGVQAQQLALNDSEKAMVEKLKDPKYTFRSPEALTKGTGAGPEDTKAFLERLKRNGFAYQVEGKKGELWGLSSSGRSQF